MESFFSLFHCDSFTGNRGYEDRFQCFVLSRDEKNCLRSVEHTELERLISLLRGQPSNYSRVRSLARILGTSLEHAAYDLFIEDIGLAVAITIFYDNAVETLDGSADFEKTKDFYYRKYCLFKFASFLDLLHPGVVHWRGQAELWSVPLVCVGLDRFQAAGLQGRTSMLSRWIQNPGLAAFSEKRAKQSEAIMQRRAFLLKLDNLSAAKVAQQLDDAGVKPKRKFPSYTAWFRAKQKSFESWLSRERAESRRVWKEHTRTP